MKYYDEMDFMEIHEFRLKVDLEIQKVIHSTFSTVL